VSRKDHPHAPDGRYFVARGKLDRCTNPGLADTERRRLIKKMMQARMAVRKAQDEAEMAEARAAVHEAKVALGERGPVWWDDDAPDYSGADPAQTPYADWWKTVAASS
jgi:hypothetical protein